MGKIPFQFPELHFGQQCIQFQPFTLLGPLH
jgi:hypothetical protein